MDPDDTPSPSAAGDIRIARSLIGATPAQLAAYIGAQPDMHAMSAPNRPVRCLDTLAVALRAAIGWYHEGTGAPPAMSAYEPGADVEVHRLVRQYLTLRSEWERREARLLAQRVSEKAMRRERPGVRRALLVDDASDILITVGAFLEADDFAVLRASNADMALELLGGAEPVHLLVTDHAMPGMNGCDLVFQACRSHPGLRSLIITGYPQSDQLASLPPGVSVLAKPFRRAQLIERVRTLFTAQEGVGGA